MPPAAIKADTRSVFTAPKRLRTPSPAKRMTAIVPEKAKGEAGRGEVGRSSLEVERTPVQHRALRHHREQRHQPDHVDSRRLGQAELAVLVGDRA